MTTLCLAEMTWTEVRDLDRSRAIPLLPIGAVEAHGPHLPLSTDGIIARGMVDQAARRLEKRGLIPLILPGLDYTAAPFADRFAGTLSLRPETVTAMLVDIGNALAAQSFRVLGLANAHLDPTHLGSLYRAVKTLRGDTALAVAFPDVTRKELAPRLTEEFKSGACHAGCYEGSMVLATRPDLVRQEVSAGLAPNPSSLSVAIRMGKESFEQAGGPQAYFGDPSAATADEGQETLAILGEMLEEAVVAALAS
ncbi:MAG: creatininase family protein [Deltaproteobacteria bacterium]|nr:creatininase family protein [Deltaproteobacteria bacterium]